MREVVGNSSWDGELFVRSREVSVGMAAVKLNLQRRKCLRVSSAVTQQLIFALQPGNHPTFG